MRTGSVTKSVLFLAALGLLLPLLASARETPPVPYRSAPLIPWAKKVGEHRFRSPRNYDDTLNYYRKTILGAAHIVREKIINTSQVRAVFFRNKKPNARWEGLNVYEYKGSTIIYVVFSDKELLKIEQEKKQAKEKPKKKKKKRRKKKK
jgi:hypothetical protein